MKTFLMLFLALNSFSIFAFEKTCYGTIGGCSHSNNKICGTVTKVDASLYRISNLEQIRGCAAWGVSRFKNKNKICRNIITQYGETQKVHYYSNSAVRGNESSTQGTESIGEISCVVISQ